MHSHSLASLALDATPLEARAEAEHQLARVTPCRCCVNPRVHLSRYIGSTLFLDDDPAELQQAIPPAERARWTVRLIAACIVLYGRARLDAFGRS
jgi:hypothetical protein